MRILFLLVCFIPLTGKTQDDSIRIRHMPSVEIVKEIKIERTQTRIIQKEDIEKLAPIDLGDLLQKLPGATIRSYGSIGALKTVSFNGLGAQHSGVVLDGFMVSNMLAGQVNLSQIQVEGINTVYLDDERVMSRLLPVKSRLLGSSLMISSGLMHKSLNKGVEGSLSTGYSSFDTYEAGGRVKYSGERSFLSAFGYFRESKGDFPYLFENGSNSSIQERKNNDYKELVGVIAIGSNFTDHVSGSLKLNGKKITQGLPGAIILYNDTRDERLEMDEFEIDGNLRYKMGRNYVRVYYTGLMRNTVYNDPTYLNIQGFIRNQYIEQDHTLGATSFHILNNVDLEAGVSAESQFLTTFGVDFNSPRRFTGAGLFKLEHYLGNWKGQYQLGILAVDQKQNELNNAFVRVMPRIKFFKLGTSTMHMFEVNNAYRLPSFNELYFGSVGNPDLEPENAYQFHYSYSKNIERGKFHSSFEIRFNSSYVDNKIVSVPTKNMFVWSIQNIEQTFGVSSVIANTSSIDLGKFKLSGTMNYQFQRVLDISDRSEPTYLDQVAYVPLHTGSLDLGLKYLRYQLNVGNYLVGYRYVLNENIDPNLEQGYLISDVSFKIKLIDKEKHVLSVQGVAKNIFNVQYAFIRGFVMPGRNYLIKLCYAFK